MKVKRKPEAEACSKMLHALSEALHRKASAALCSRVLLTTGRKLASKAEKYTLLKC